MKKFAALLLGSALALGAVAGLAACTDPDDPNKKDPTGTLESGRVTDGETAKDFVAPARTDTRASDAYEAYDKDGKKIGSYKTISAAVNATVKNDAAYFADEKVAVATQGGYVTPKGNATKIFVSRKGYAEDSDDQFWYYDGGNALAAYDCWNATESVPFLTNTKLIVNEIITRGSVSLQGWNGYALLDEFGAEIPSTAEVNAAQSWELSKTMDASVQMFPARKAGVSGLRYKLDLSEVKIRPAYAGSDPVYAFFGFHAWQDYYVVSVGLACDVTTGNWYSYVGSSRNDSFNDVTYNLGECVMTSTWHEETGGGYFTPDKKSVSMEIATKRMIDEEEDEKYWVDDLKIEIEEGATYERRLTDSLVNEYASGYPLAPDNGFVFVAGLDVKNNVQATGKVDAVDYTNGAQFLNLAVTQAEIYFPTEEEITDVEYALAKIDPALRGKWHDALLANDESTEGTYDYTILGTYACTSYAKKDGKDFYSFDYDKSPVSTELYAGQLKTLVDKINTLKTITPANAQEMEELIEEVKKMNGDDANHANSTVHQRYLSLLDFSPLANAQEVFEASLALSEDAQDVLDGLRSLGVITAYDYKGWEAPQGAEDVKGYLYTELLKFRDLYAVYETLPTTGEFKNDKPNVERLFGKEKLDAWKNLSEDLTTFLADEDVAAFELTTVGVGMTGTATYASGTDVLKMVLDYGHKILKKSASVWKPEEMEAADANFTDVLDSDSNWFVSFHMCYVLAKYYDAELELPRYAEELLAKLGYYDSEFAEDFDYLYHVLPVVKTLVDNPRINYITEEMAEVINAYMVGHDKWAEAGLNWNFTTTDTAFAAMKDFGYRNKRYKTYFGLEGNTNLIDYLKMITDIAVTRTDGLTVTSNGTGVSKEVAVGQPDPLSAEATAFLDKYLALPALSSYEFKGWTTTEADTAGYLKADLDAALALKTQYDAFGQKVKDEVLSQVSVTDLFGEWVSLSEAVNAAKNVQGSFNAVVPGTDAAQTLSGENAVLQLIEWTIKLRSGKYASALLNGDASEKKLGSDSDWIVSFHIIYLTRALKAANATLPAYVNTLLADVEYAETHPLVKDVSYVCDIFEQWYRLKGIEEGGGKPFLDDALAAVVNKYVDFENFSEGGMVWNWGLRGDGVTDLRPNAGEAGRNTIYKKYFGTKDVTLHGALNYIGAIVSRDSEKDSGLNACGLGFTKAVTAVTEPVLPKLGAEGAAVLAVLEKIGKLENYEYKGWTAADDNVKGYLKSSADYFAAQDTFGKYGKLGEEDKTLLHEAYTAEEIGAWNTLATELKALETSMEGVSVSVPQVKDVNNFEAEAQTYTGIAALGELFGGIYAIRNSESGTFNSNANLALSLRTLYLKAEIEAQLDEAELPTVITELYAAIVARVDTATNQYDGKKFETDYVKIAAILKEVKRVKDLGEEAFLDATMAKVVNDYLVNFAFVEPGFAWNSGQSGQGNGELRDNDTNYEVLFGLEDASSWKANVSVILDIVKRDSPDATLMANGLGVTAQVTGLSEKPDIPADVQKVIAALAAFSDVTSYDYKGWKTTGDDVKGYLYSEVQKFKTDFIPLYETIKSDAGKLSTLKANVNETLLNTWLALAEDETITETIAKLDTITAFEIDKTPYGATEKAQLTGQQVFDELLKYAYKIAAGSTWTGEENDDPNDPHKTELNVDNHWYVGIRLHFLKAELDAKQVELPAFVAPLLEKIKFGDFESSFNALYGTVKLAQRIKTSSLTKLDDLTDDEISFLNAYWTKELNTMIGEQWGGNNNFQSWWGARVAAVVKLAGGTLTESEGSTALFMKDYIFIVADFLEENEYTVNANRWGVTQETIGKTAE